jgi:hypothetical protein
VSLGLPRERGGFPVLNFVIGRPLNENGDR